MPRYTTRCITIAIANAQAITVTTFGLIAYILKIPVLSGLLPKKGDSKICTSVVLQGF
jgi:hypothetical protein